jgi:hypothetical protein
MRSWDAGVQAAILTGLVLLTAPVPVAGQELPTACADRSAPPEFALTPDTDPDWELVDSLELLLENGITDHVDSTRLVTARRLWQRDSMAVERSLPYIMLGPFYTDFEAYSAMWLYRSLSRRPTPVLRRLAGGEGASRRGAALGTLKGPLTPAEARLVLSYACDASWLLSRLRTDVALRERIEVVDPGWTDEQRTVLEESVRLLAGTNYEAAWDPLLMMPED